MKIEEIIKSIKAANPEAIGKISDKASARLLNLAFAEIVKAIEAQEDGIIKINGLGGFRIRKVEKDKDGAKVTSKKVMFTAAKSSNEKKKKKKGLFPRSSG